MLHLNPQLQTKIFESLVLHMKAERRAFSNPPNPHAPHGSAASPAAPSPDAYASRWDGLARDLNRLGLNKTTADALVSWAASQADQSRAAPAKIRILHPMEREFISVEAYDYLLELYRLGLIGPPQLETLIENCGFLPSLPAGREQVAKMALQAFTENLETQGLGSSH